MNEISFTGGVTIGLGHASAPFAELKISKDRLDLNATIVGNLVFRPEDIISIEPVSRMMRKGIKINHRVPTYKEKVIFWTSTNPGDIIQQIQQTGFFDRTSKTLNQADSENIVSRQKQGGFPIKTPFAIAIVVIWNILFFIDSSNSSSDFSGAPPFGNGAIFALGIVVLSSLFILTSKKFRKLALKEGRELQDISKFLYFVMLICGVMMFAVIMVNYA